jgi:hypothetical protein
MQNIKQNANKYIILQVNKRTFFTRQVVNWQQQRRGK